MIRYNIAIGYRMAPLPERGESLVPQSQPNGWLSNARGDSFASNLRCDPCSRTFLAVTDGHQAVRGNAYLGQKLLGGRRPAIAQCQVIFRRAPLIAVALHQE